jgi:hypothetical protein
MKFTSYTLPSFRSKLEKVLDQFAKENGIDSIKVGTIRFSNNTCRFKVEVVGEPAGEKRVGGMSASIKVGDRFLRGRTVYTVTSLDGYGKYPVRVTTQNGKRYKIAESQLVEMEKI